MSVPLIEQASLPERVQQLQKPAREMSWHAYAGSPAFAPLQGVCAREGGPA